MKKSNDKKRNYYVIVASVVFLIVGIVLREGVKEDKKVNCDIDFFQLGMIDTRNGLLLNIEEQGEMIIVNTVFGSVKYPSMFSDIVAIVPHKGEVQNSFKFYGKLENGTYLLYTLTFDEKEANSLGRVVDVQGNSSYLHMEMEKLPRKLTESDQVTFYAVQETVNDVLLSLLENK